MTFENSRLAVLRLGPSVAEHLEHTRFWRGQGTKTELFQCQRFDQVAEGCSRRFAKAGRA